MRFNDAYSGMRHGLHHRLALRTRLAELTDGKHLGPSRAQKRCDTTSSCDGPWTYVAPAEPVLHDLVDDCGTTGLEVGP